MAKIAPSFSFARLLANVGFTALSHYIAKVLKKVNFENRSFLIDFLWRSNEKYG
ncbi:MAG TPA: hypothetical protein PLU31_01040 [Treponemataceae bacterium]|nr:hypothetical protein [Treponemataceae bacterium]